MKPVARKSREQPSLEQFKVMFELVEGGNRVLEFRDEVLQQTSF